MPVFFLVVFDFLVDDAATAGFLSGNGEPEGAAAIDSEAVVGLNVQTRERSTIGIVRGGVDGVARTVHLGRECHITQIGAADSHRGDRSRGRHAAARDVLADTVDGSRRVVAGLYSMSMSEVV